MEMKSVNIIRNPLFSVLIANHNNACYLEDALRSVYAQTYTNWEIVILDDGSTDSSKAVYESLKDNPQIRIYYNGSCRGVGYTKNELISLAKGQICGFLDADDRLEENAIEVMINMHLAHPECSLIYSKFRELSQQDILKETTIPLGAIRKDEDLLISSWNMISHFATFKQVAYAHTIGINIALRSAEDRDLYLKLEESGRILYVDRNLYQYRVDNVNSISRGNINKERNAQYYLAIANLNAYWRRIDSKHNLFLNNKEKYHDGIIGEVKRLKRNKLVQADSFLILRFIWFYLKINQFSLKAIKRTIKIMIQ